MNKILSKSPQIETLRGIAILLVVIGHVIGSTNSGGMKVEDSSFYRYLYCLFENIRMPLLTVISGWVYALHPVEINKAMLFLKKKIRRLLFPMIFVGTSYFIIQYITPSTNNKGEFINLWKIYVYPYTLYWYLPALFLVFSCCIPFEYFGILKTFKKWAVLFFISFILCFCTVSEIIPSSIPNIFAFKNALYLMPFFLFGIGLNKFKQILNTPNLRKIYFILTILGILSQQVYYFIGNEQFSFYSYVQFPLFIGIVTVAFLIYQDIKVPFLIGIAEYAYSIYLFHGFGTSGGRIILKIIGINNDFIIFIFASIFAVSLAIATDRILRRWTITRKLFLGKK